MKSVVNILKNMFSLRKEISKPMGRWNIDYCTKKISDKVDLSNEDHCGTCGQYAITKIKPKKNPQPSKIKPIKNFNNSYLQSISNKIQMTKRFSYSS